MNGLFHLGLSLWVLLAPAGPAVGGPADEGRLWTLRKGDLEQVVAFNRRALEKNPNDLSAARNLGRALAELGQTQEAEAAFRRAIQVAPAQWAAYAHLADLVAQDPKRWEHREEVTALLQAGLGRMTNDPVGRTSLAIRVANFERSVGRTAAARARLEELVAGALTPEQRKRVLDLLEVIQGEERMRAFTDWPAPRPGPTLAAALAQAEQAFSRGETEHALKETSRLLAALPDWRAPRQLRARVLESVGRYDDAVRELGTLLEFGPSDASGWRTLGRILTLHGGALDAARADEALRTALALEPGYWDLWLLRARIAIRRGRAEEGQRALDRYLREAPGQANAAELGPLRAAIRALSAAGAGGDGHPSLASAPPPSDKARKLYQDALLLLDHGDPAGLAHELLDAALADSPAFADAAATVYAMSGQVPERTVTALWNDGAALLDLARKIRALGPEAQAKVPVRTWIDRALELGQKEAYLERAALLLGGKERAQGLADLAAFVASAPSPTKMDEARALLETTASALGDGQTPRADATPLLARLQLAADRPVEAAALLGTSCGERTARDRLAALGMVHEWSGELEPALRCYREALARGPDDTALSHLAGIAARAPLPLLAGLEPLLAEASQRGIATAEWAQARLDMARGARAEALARIDRFLGASHRDDPNFAAAEAARQVLAGVAAQAAAHRQAGHVAFALGVAVLALALLLAFFHGATVSGALARRPGLYPGIARAIADLRHDVLKHRTSVLGLLAAGQAERGPVAKVFWEPARASDLTASAYEQLRGQARARGVTLRRLGREPTFGPLVHDLRRAEQLLEQPGELDTLKRIDHRLRQLHTERLTALLSRAPKTRLCAALLTQWIKDVEAEVRARGGSWTEPALLLQGLELAFPVEQAALATLFANLLRNAQAAVAQEGAKKAGAILVRVAPERDAAGRRLVVLLVGDSAQSPLSLETIEHRESGRGLAIIRDLVHEWRGHLVVRAEAAPYAKGVGACFPA